MYPMIFPSFPTCPHRSPKNKKTQFQTVEGLNLSRYIPKRTSPLTQQFCLVQINNMFLAYIYIHTHIYGVSKGGTPKRENPSINGWFGGTPISGNHHVYIYTYICIYIYSFISIFIIYIYICIYISIYIPCRFPQLPWRFSGYETVSCSWQTSSWRRPRWWLKWDEWRGDLWQVKNQTWGLLWWFNGFSWDFMVVYRWFTY